MPIEGARYRFKGSGASRVRLAFKGNKVVEATKWPEGKKKGKSKRIHSKYSALKRMAHN